MHCNLALYILWFQRFLNPLFQGQILKRENSEGNCLENFWSLVVFFSLRKTNQTKWMPFQLEDHLNSSS